METFKTEKSEKKEEPVQKKKFLNLLDEDEVEIKRLDSEDIEESVAVMRKCSFDVTDKEVGSIVAYEKSFGATVNRMIIGVGLAWPAYFDPKTKTLTSATPNCLYLEDPAVLLAYEGRGVRRILVKERENEARNLGYKYAVAYLSEDLPKGEVTDYIREGGSALERLYLTENYEFAKTERGILAFKKLD
ncbi:GNAT family N-acetyltransferase [Candidatus Micrarchaeota archaeon]|nr:GNAT family N-acetyltransferase [Candidatus Micrarchaeota archaeon]